MIDCKHSDKILFHLTREPVNRQILFIFCYFSKGCFRKLMMKVSNEDL